MTNLLEVKNIETYYDLVYAIRGASFAVEEGSITAILGNNGAGKSTILKTIMGLIEDQPDKGIIEYKGKPIQHKDTDEIVRRGIAYVPEGREVFEELTVYEHLSMGAYLRNDSSGIKKDIEKVFTYFPVLKGIKSVGRDAFRRRAADACHRKGVNVKTNPFDPG